MALSSYSHYWDVNGSIAGSAQVWSAMDGAYVGTADADYVAWVALGNTATVIASEALLWPVINQTALTVYLGGQGYGIVTGGTITTDQQLTNPIMSVYTYISSTAGLKVILPKANLPISRPIGVPFYVYNSILSTQSILLVTFGSAASVVTIAPGEFWGIIPYSNATEAGLFTYFPTAASAIKFIPTGAIVSTSAQTAIAELDTKKAPLASPALTGNPTAPTQSQADDSTKISTTAYVRAAITAVLNGVAGAFDTLAEIVTEVATKAAGAASSTDNAAARFDSTTGKILQNSALLVADTTGALSRSGAGGIPLEGTNTNDSAAAGYVGQVLSNSAASTAVSLTTNVPVDMTSLSIPAGDWDVSGVASIAPAGAPLYANAAISPTSATLPSIDSGDLGQYGPSGAGISQSVPAPTMRVSVASATTYYLVGRFGFTVTATGGGKIWARRAR